MAGTVRGTFDLNSRPASSALRKLRTEGDAVDRTMVKVGASMDKVATAKQTARLYKYERALSKIERTAKRSFGTIRREWSSTDRQVEKSVLLESKALDHLRTKLEEVGATDAKPTVDVDGVAEALAQVETLHARLRSLGRARATPAVGLGASPFGAARGGGGSSFSGGRTGKSAFKSLSVGPLSLGKAGFPALIAGALPAANALGGATIATGGSLASAGLGAGALGITGGGVLATAIASIGAVAIPTVGKLKEASTALSAFQKQVTLSGRNSVQAREKWREFNAIAGQTPGVRQLLASRSKLSKNFQSRTGSARSDFLGIGTDAFQAGNALTPQFAGQTNRFFGAAGQASDRFFGEFATGGRSRRFLKSAGDEATSSLDEMESITEHVLGSLMNITVASRPFFQEALKFLQEWTGGWLDSTDNIGKTRKEVGGMVSNLKQWLRLGGATFKLMKDLLTAGSGSGKSLVGDLTKQIGEWDRWIQKNPKQVRGFFRETVSSTKKLAGAFGTVAKSLFEISKMLTPILDQFSQLVGFLGSTGLLTPSGLPLLLGAGAGIRNIKRGASARILGTTGGVAGGGVGELAAGAALGGGGAAAAARGGKAMYSGLRGMGKTYGLARDFGYSRTAAMGAEIGSAPGVASFARGFGSRVLPVAALMGGLSFASTPGGFNQRVQAAGSSLSFGLLPEPKSTQQMEDDAVAKAQGISGHYGRRFGSSIAGLRKQLGGIRRSRQHLLTPQEQGGFTGFLTKSINPLGGNFGHAPEVVTDENRNAARALSRQAQQKRFQIRQTGMSRGGELAGDFQKAFLTRSKDDGIEKALEITTQRALKKMGHHLGVDGSRIFAQSTLSWAKEAARKNPELQDEYAEMAKKIEERFRAMGHTIQVIHGRIYTDTSTSWKRISQIIGTESWKAEQESSKAFGQLETEMFRRLRGFGFSTQAAHSLIQSGGDIKGAMTMGAGMAEVGGGRIDPHFKGTGPGAAGSKGKKGARGGRFAGGGRLGGMGRQDTVPVPGGHGAPGEFYIGNRHTERRLNEMLRPYGTSVGAEIGSEKMKHSSAPLSGQAFASSMGRRFAKGGSIMPAAKLAQGMGLSISGGPGFGGIPSSGHVGDSLHYSGLAYDVSGAAATMWKYRKAAEKAFLGHGLNELFYDPYAYYIDQGKKVPGSLGGHSDHVHVGFFPGGAKGGSISGLGGGGGMGGGREVHLKGRRSRQGGIPGAMATKAMENVRGGLEGSVNRKLGRRGGGGGGLPPGTGGGSPRANQALARSMLGRFGWGASQFGPLKSLWTQESGWSQTARNPSSGAYGIPQSLPASKMGPEAQGTGAAAARAQILWGLKYIQERYGSPSGAWAHEQSNNWYAKGGRGRMSRFAGSFRRGGSFLTRAGRPVQFEAGEGMDQEEVSVRPRRRPGGVAGGRSFSGGARKVEAHAHFHGPVNVRSEKDLEKIKEMIAEALTDALQKSDSVPDSDLLG